MHAKPIDSKIIYPFHIYVLPIILKTCVMIYILNYSLMLEYANGKVQTQTLNCY